MSRANTVAPTTRAVPTAVPRTTFRTRRGGHAQARPVRHPAPPAWAATRSSVSRAAGASGGCGRQQCARTSARSIQPVSVMTGKRSHRRPGAASCSSSPISVLTGSRFPASAGAIAGTYAAPGRHVPPTHALLSPTSIPWTRPDACAPCGAVGSASAGRPWCSCAHGSRACSSVSGCAGCMSAFP
jgi:hypothetical protein